MRKRILAVLLVSVMLVICALPAVAAAPKIKKTEYEGNGKVEVEFTTKVTYKRAKVTVKDPDGQKISTRIIEKDDDDFTFKATGLKAGTQYTYTISGVRRRGTNSYGKVSGIFTVPATGLAVKNVEYDREDRELEVEFTTRVQFKDLKVSATDGSGNSLTVKRVKKGRDDLEITFQGAVAGTTYTVVISGLRAKGESSYTSITTSFTA